MTDEDTPLTPPPAEEQPPPQPTTADLLQMLANAMQAYGQALIADVQRTNGGKLVFNPAPMFINAHADELKLTALLSLLIEKGVVTDAEIAGRYAAMMNAMANQLIKQGISADVKGVLLDGSRRKGS